MRCGNNMTGIFAHPPEYARYDHDASGIRWRLIVNVKETIEIKSLVSLSPTKILR